jgi:hypothetical protein
MGTTVNGQRARLVLAVTGNYFSASLSQVAIQEFSGLISPMAIGANNSSLLVHLGTCRRQSGRQKDKQGIKYIRIGLSVKVDMK